MNLDKGPYIDWLEARDTFLGHNRHTKDLSLGLKLAANCSHPDAQWLTEVFAGHECLSSDEEAREILQRNGGNDLRSICFAALLHRKNHQEIKVASDRGNAFAQAIRASDKTGKESFELAKKSAFEGNERDGWSWLGYCYEIANGCDDDVNMAIHFHEIAAKMGSIASMLGLGYLLPQFSAQRWFWLGTAALRGSHNTLISNVGKLTSFKGWPEMHPGAFYQIGRAFEATFVARKRQPILFGSVVQANVMKRVEEAVTFYQARVALRKSIDTWTMSARRFGMVKDMRLMVAKMVWDSRNDEINNRLESK